MLFAFHNFRLKQFSSYKELSEIWSYMYFGLHIKYRLLLTVFNETWIFLTDFKKKTQKSNFMKICPVGAKMFWVDRQTDWQTDTMKVIVAFCNFANKSKNYIIIFRGGKKLSVIRQTYWEIKNYGLHTSLQYDYIALIKITVRLDTSLQYNYIALIERTATNAFTKYITSNLVW